MQLRISIKRTFISRNVYDRNTKNIIINDLSMYFKKLEKQTARIYKMTKNNKSESRYNDAENQFRKSIKSKNGSSKRLKNWIRSWQEKNEKTDHQYQK